MPTAIRKQQIDWSDIDELLDLEPTQVEVVNSIAVTPVYTVSIAAGLLGTDRCLELGLVGDYLNNTPGNQGVRFRISLGASVLWDDITGLVLTTSAGRRGVVMEFSISNVDATGQQHGGGSVYFGRPSGGGTIGTGALGDLSTVNRIGAEMQFATVAVDTTIAQTLTIDYQNVNANANVSFRKQLAWTKLVRVA